MAFWALRNTATLGVKASLLLGALAVAAPLATPAASASPRGEQSRAQAPELSLPVTPDEAKTLRRAGALGRAIYDYDQAASVTTDAMLAQIPRSEFPAQGGWVVEPRSDGALVVTYFARELGRERAVFVAAEKGGRVLESRVVPNGRSAPPLSPGQARLAAAAEVAGTRVGGAGHRSCTPGPFNTVVLPPSAAGAPTSVYLFSAQTENGKYPFGGHFRVDVDAAGKIVGDRAFTRSCLTMDPAAQGNPPGQPAALFLTHLLDPTPTEIHVYMSLLARLPVYVGTSDARVWKVDGERITLVTRDVRQSGP